MTDNNDTATLAYIRYVLDEMQVTPSALAKRAGISSTTLTRPLNNIEHKFNLSATTLEKIAAVSGVNPGPFFANRDFASRTLAAVHDPNVYNPTLWKMPSRSVNATIVIGAAALGNWQELGKNSDLKMLFLVPSQYSHEDCFAVHLLDNHASDIALFGEFALCVKYSVYPRDIVTGKHVLLERRRDGGRLIELTIRRVQHVKSGWQLSTAVRGTQDHVTLIELPGNEDATVIGVVEYVIKHVD